VIRSRSFAAASIEATVPSFDDYAQICTTAEGYSAVDSSGSAKRGNGTASQVRRYVGFTRGRVTQAGRGHAPLAEYLDWLDQIDTTLRSRAKPLGVLSRYAHVAKVPERADPKSVLFDITEIRDQYQHVASGHSLDIADACCSVSSSGEIEIVANSERVSGKVTFDADRKRYVLASPDLDRSYRALDDMIPGSVVDFLNRQQAFRIVPEDWRTIYVGGHFYKPAFRVGTSFDPKGYELGHCFITDAIIGSTGLEKGTKVRRKGAGWEKNSLFGMIDSLGAGTGLAEHFGQPELLICDDMGREAADFFLCDTSGPSPRVVLIHAKASKQRRECSASALHEVCAQAVKNLAYLAMFNRETPSHVRSNSWNKPWKCSGIGNVEKRVRRGTGTSRALWNRIQGTVNNPMAGKEVWLLLGQVLSRSAFEQKLAKRNPPAEALQAAYLLHATMTDVAAVGAKLRIICGP
jgi:hypothetical protein